MCYPVYTQNTLKLGINLESKGYKRMIVIRTHLVLASGKLVLQKKRIKRGSKDLGYNEQVELEGSEVGKST